MCLTWVKGGGYPLGGEGGEGRFVDSRVLGKGINKGGIMPAFYIYILFNTRLTQTKTTT
jgi:hypothetical protein